MLARDRGSKATNAISTFTPSKIIFPSPENFISNRAEHRARQINCVTKNKNPTPGIFSHTVSAKGEIDSTLFKGVLFPLLLFRKEYSFHDEYFENCTLTLFTTSIFTLLKIVFLSIYQTSTLLKRVALLHKDLSQLKILDILMIK